MNSKSFFILLSLGVSCSVFLGMTHVFASSEFFPHAQTLSSNGVIRTQSSEGGYRLGATISRAEAIKLALSSAGVAQSSCQVGASLSFMDVTPSLGDLCGYIEGAVTNNIISASSRFYPTTPITRGDFASIIVKSFDVNYPNLIGTPSEGTMYFTDVKPSVVGANYINRLATSGCINTSRQYFNPTWSITRGEAFKMMACLIGKKNGNEGNSTNTHINPNTNPNSTCSSLYWKDTTNTSCQAAKQFCGAYMYQGLQTFATQAACLGTTTEQTTTTTNSNYIWSTASYGACSKTCGEGVQTRTVTCKRTTDNTIVADSFCIATGVVKPVTQKLCNTQSCGSGTSVSNNYIDNLPALPSNPGNTNPNWPFSEPDPGYGLWIPPGTQKLYVADPGNELGLLGGIDMNLPACLNTRPSQGWNRCRYMSTYVDGKYGLAGEVKGKRGDIISLRVRTANLQEMNNVLGDIRMSAFDHSSYGGDVDVSISKIPGDFNVKSECFKNITGSDKLFLSDKDSYVINPQRSITTCKLDPDTKYYINIKNNWDSFGGSIVEGARFFAGGHGKIKSAQDGYSGRWKYYPASSGFESDYGANYWPWENYNNSIVNVRRARPQEVNGTSCNGVYGSSRNTWYYPTGEKIVCEPGIPNKYQMQYSTSTTTVSTLEVSDVFQAGAPSFSVNIPGVGQKTVSHNIKGGQSLADIQATVIKDFAGGYGCSSLPSLPYTREYIVGVPSNPTNCKKVGAGYMGGPEWTCDFTTTKAIYSCNMIVPAPANTQADIDAANGPKVPYKFFINGVDPVSTSKCNLLNVGSSECPTNNGGLSEYFSGLNILNSNSSINLSQGNTITNSVNNIKKENTLVCAEILNSPTAPNLVNKGICDSDNNYVQRTETNEWIYAGNGWTVSYNKNSTSWTSIKGIRVAIHIKDKSNGKKVIWYIGVY